MKNIVIISRILAIIAFPALAEERTLIGAGYRRCFDVDLETYVDNDFSGPSLDFGLKFGANM